VDSRAQLRDSVLVAINDFITGLHARDRQNHAIMTWERYQREKSSLTLSEHQARVNAALYHLQTRRDNIENTARLQELIQSFLALIDQDFVDSLKPMIVAAPLSDLSTTITSNAEKRRQQIARIENEIRIARENKDMNYVKELNVTLRSCNTALFYRPMKNDVLDQQRRETAKFYYNAINDAGNLNGADEFLSIKSLTVNRRKFS
jgi:hypothetical protein